MRIEAIIPPMIKLAAFDLDGTLARIGEGIEREDCQILVALEELGTRIAIVSGKPAFYLCGFMRQVNLSSPILLGENGGVIEFGTDVPPINYTTLSCSESARKTIDWLRSRFSEAIPSLWYQPNIIGLTPFPKSSSEFDIIQRIIDENADFIRDVDIYRHIDSFDITPKGINKYRGLETLGRLLSISREESAAIGNGVNDYPMFEYAGLSLGVNIPDESRVTRNFADIHEALLYLLEHVKEERVHSCNDSTIS